MDEKKQALKAQLTPEEVAKELRISISAVRRLIATKALPSFAIGIGKAQKTYVKRASLNRWVRARELESGG